MSARTDQTTPARQFQARRRPRGLRACWAVLSRLGQEIAPVLNVGIAEIQRQAKAS